MCTKRICFACVFACVCVCLRLHFMLNRAGKHTLHYGFLHIMTLDCEDWHRVRVHGPLIEPLGPKQLKLVA